MPCLDQTQVKEAAGIQNRFPAIRRERSARFRMSDVSHGAQFAVFEKSGHLPFVGEPDAFAGRVESFLSAIP